MAKHKFSQVFEDERLNQTVREIEDKYATRTDINNRMVVKGEVQSARPNVSDMAEREMYVVNDGTNAYFYIRLGGKLYQGTLTEVT